MASREFVIKLKRLYFGYFFLTATTAATTTATIAIPTAG